MTKQDKLFNEKPLAYIELSDGRVGYVEDINNKQFKDDLERLGLTYELTTASAYNRYMILNKLSPEQVYHNVMGGKKRLWER